MKVIEKFIIDRDDYEYLYAEKYVGDFNNIIYRVYEANDSFYSFNVFEYTEIYGDFTTCTINYFLKFLKFDLKGYTDCNEVSNLNKDIKNLLKYIPNKTNPYLFKFKSTLISITETYNELIKDKMLIDYYNYDYEDDMEKLNNYYDIVSKVRIKED